MTTDTAWADVLRRGVFPQTPTPTLQALRDALANDDPSLIHCDTASSAPGGLDLPDDPARQACLLTWGYMRESSPTIAETECQFERICASIEESMGKPGAAAPLIDFWDFDPNARVAVRAEIEAELGRRKAGAA